ncbi:type II toxin-antitoxin system death-on-curing family toxin [Megasphaera sp. WILCCON 0056]|uniref:type II toxin-antitoxin system death-on-curing family toxin n=1 Tax=Megasphaera sp. WILCCON 0056 TaxID=3345340 RepID=UPI003A80B19C
MKHEQILIEIILEDVLAFHEEMEQRYVMDKGIHDMNLLESAVNTPFQSFAGEELYPTILDKAARLCYGLTKNHPFCDGNKRSAIHSMLVFLYVNGIDLDYTQQELEDMVVDVAADHLDCDGIKQWLLKHKKMEV